MNNKLELRKFARSFRKTVNNTVISEKILQIFLASSIYKTATNIAAYYPYGDELNITKLFSDNNKNFFLPKINENDEMIFAPFKMGDFLRVGRYGILEPSTSKADYKVFDLMIIPALMVDHYGYRLGYGKGYYDKFFAKNNLACKKVVFIIDDLFVDKIPHDDLDVPVDCVVTENFFETL